MPTPTIIDGFDHQVKDTTGFGTDTSARLWSAINNAAGITFDTTNKRTGTASLKVAEDGVTLTNIRKAIPAGNRILVGSVYFRVATAPTVNSMMMRFVGPTNDGRFRIRADGRIEAGFLNGTAQVGPSIADGAWHRLDFRVNTSAATFTIDWQVDGVDQTQATLSGQTAADMTGVNFGSSQAADTLTVWFDDFVASYTSADYPLGAHEVRFLVPNAEGTHNNPANTLERASDGADIDGVNVVAWSMLDEWPPASGTDNADTVTQVATNTAAYVEVQFADITDTTVWGVEAVAALQSDGTAANNGQTRIRDSNGTETTVWSGDMSDTTPRYNRAIVTVPTGGWTQAHVNALRARMGYSSDANPQPEWLALALQVAVVPPTGQTFTQDVAGSLDASGALVRQAGKAVAGSSTSSGALVRRSTKAPAGSVSASGALARQPARTLSGSSAPAGALARRPGRALAGSITPAATLTALRTILLSVGGSLTAAGTLVRRAAKLLGGNVNGAGALARLTGRTFAGAVSTSGTVVRTALLTLAGSVTAAGSLARRAATALSSSITVVGSLTRQGRRLFGGSTAPDGTLRRMPAIASSGQVAPSGALSKARTAVVVFAGTISAAGTTVKMAARAFAGSASPSGALVKMASRAFGGATTAAASLARLASRLFAGSVTAAGSAAASHVSGSPPIAGPVTLRVEARREARVSGRRVVRVSPRRVTVR